jgi:hypothetical protein
MRLDRSLVARASALCAVGAAVVFGYAALYAATHAQPVSWITEDGGTHPSASDVAANQGAVAWPAILAIVALLGAIALLRRPGRAGYLTTGAVASVVLGIAATSTMSERVFGPPTGVLVCLGAVWLLLSIIGWFMSDPLPEGLPGWPWHHGGV